MQLKIKNVAKLKEATINIDGITVIAEENNTGKSTIGKLNKKEITKFIKF